jgi:hypothetical protein
VSLVAVLLENLVLDLLAGIKVRRDCMFSPETVSHGLAVRAERSIRAGSRIRPHGFTILHRGFN